MTHSIAPVLIAFAILLAVLMLGFGLGFHAGRAERFGPCPWCRAMYEAGA